MIEWQAYFSLLTADLEEPEKPAASGTEEVEDAIRATFGGMKRGN